MIVLHFVCFLHFWYWKIQNLKKIFSRGYFIIKFCTFMANIKVVGLKTTKLWLFYVFCVFCIFGIEKNKILKNVFSKGYFKIVLCTFMTNFKVISLKTVKLWLFYVLCVFCIFGIEKKMKFQKIYFRKVTLKLCYVRSWQISRL